MRNFLRLASVGAILILGLGIFVIWIMPISLSSQTIPTVVNGIATATSIMVGFSGTMMGFMFSGTNRKRGLTRRMRIAGGFAIIGLMWSATMIFITFLDQAILRYTDALRSGLLGLLFSLCTFLGLATMLLDKILEEGSSPE